MKELKIRAEFIEELLGSANNDKEIHAEFIASKAPDAPSREEEIEAIVNASSCEIPSVLSSREEEIEAIGVDAVIEKGKTIFPKDEDENPFLYDYQIKGFLKNAAKAFNYVKKIPAYKTKIDNLVFVFPRKILLQFPEGAGLTDCQRPLRAQTAQGERVALANSEAAPAGTVIEFTIKCLEDTFAKNLKSWLDYGELNGIGQWHNSGKGRFKYTIIEESEEK